MEASDEKLQMRRGLRRGRKLLRDPDAPTRSAMVRVPDVVWLAEVRVMPPLKLIDLAAVRAKMTPAPWLIDDESRHQDPDGQG